MNWIRKNIKRLLFVFVILIALFVGRFFAFWVVYPCILGVLIFYSISFYSKKNYLVYPAIILGTLSLLFSFSEAYLMYSTNTAPKYYYSVEDKILDSNDLQEAIQEKKNTKKQDNKSTQVNIEDKENSQNSVALFEEDPLLGYVAKKGFRSVQTARYDIRDGSAIYNVINTTDDRGLRIAPNHEETADTAIILFGCSYTFGEGLNDDETYAWRLAEALGAQYQIYNYGVKGWGSNQTLALLESGRLDELKGKYKKVYGFYLTTPGIELRSSGIASWSKAGPWYIIDGDSVKYAGNFGDRPNSQIQLRGKFVQSLVLQKLVAFTGDDFKRPAEEILSLDAAIIKRISELFTETFENSTFTAVLYTDFEGLETKLKDKSVSVLEVRPYFPEEPTRNPRFILHELDGHPNAQATKIVAKAYYDYIKENSKEY